MAVIWAGESSLQAVYEEARWVRMYLYRNEEMQEFVDLVRAARRIARY